jgi:hypothetical protein
VVDGTRQIVLKADHDNTIIRLGSDRVEGDAGLLKRFVYEWYQGFQ